MAQEIKCENNIAARRRLAEFIEAQKQGLYPCMSFSVEGSRVWATDDDFLNEKIRMFGKVKYVKILSSCGEARKVEFNADENRLTFFVRNVSEFVRRLKRDYALKEQVSRTMWELA